MQPNDRSSRLEPVADGSPVHNSSAPVVPFTGYEIVADVLGADVPRVARCGAWDAMKAQVVAYMADPAVVQVAAAQYRDDVMIGAVGVRVSSLFGGTFVHRSHREAC
jgi:hypothetical protein